MNFHAKALLAFIAFHVIVTGGGLRFDPSTLATNATSLKTGDGVAAWVESTGSNRTLKARFAGSVRTLSTLSTATLYGTTSGQVVFGEQGKTYSWNANTNSSTLRLDTAPGQAITSGGYLYFVLGNGQTVYRVGL